MAELRAAKDEAWEAEQAANLEAQQQAAAWATQAAECMSIPFSFANAEGMLISATW